jgi:capsular polysaccharide biosynthesis protein
MEIRRYLSIVRRRWLLVVAILAAALAAGWLITPREDTYTATSLLYVGAKSIDISPTSGSLSGDRVAGLDRLITTFTQLVRTEPIADATAKSGQVPRSPGEIAAHTSAKQVTDASLIRVSFSDRDPAVAAAAANAVSAALVEQVRQFEPRDTKTEAGEVLSVFEPARRPSAPNPSGLRRNLILTGLFGLIVAGAVLALLEYLDITLRSPDDAERELELPVLGVLPSMGDRVPFTPPVNVRPVSAAEPTSRSGATVG